MQCACVKESWRETKRKLLVSGCECVREREKESACVYEEVRERGRVNVCDGK